MTTMVTWMQSDGAEMRTRVYTSELRDFCADIQSVDGYVIEMHEEA